ncbi:AIR synthase family protein [Halospeciosus flavus]|uniref:AIR synthase family protein n=1 Tax=Halospeciosus flavus TaxID=3032283 RepID=A0ABD5Z5D2_9EURY|nr:AIR synthase family protein [Halospeciosus flavus]
MDPGKVSREFFDTHVAPNLGADRDDVRLGPTHGADFGVLSLGERRVCALATDPVFVLRDLGLDRAAWFAFHILVSDAALSGIPPTHLALDLNLPLDADPAEVGRVMEVFDREARDLGISIVTGHTGAYEGCSFPTVGAGTALAVGDESDLVLPTGAEPGDRLVVTKGPAIETTGLLAVCFGDDLDLPESTVAAARERFDEASPVRDALAAAATGEVTAMHDATERGVDNALHELADAAGVRLSVERERFPVGDGVHDLCEHLGIDPWTSSSEGTVVLAVREGGVGAVLDALGDEGIRAAEVGRVESGSGVEVDGEELPEPTSDPLWPAYERLRGDGE